MLTLAPGFLSVEKAGSQQARREELRTIVTAVRTLLAGEEAQLNGTPARLRNAPDRPPDVLLLASGPRLVGSPARWPMA